MLKDLILEVKRDLSYGNVKEIAIIAIPKKGGIWEEKKDKTSDNIETIRSKTLMGIVILKNGQAGEFINFKEMIFRDLDSELPRIELVDRSYSEMERYFENAIDIRTEYKIRE